MANMYGLTKITAEIGDHGEFTVTADQLDMAMMRHLPASPAQLREKLTSINGGQIDYSDVHDVTSFLIILAHADL